jgi:hypothetical protein
MALAAKKLPATYGTPFLTVPCKSATALLLGNTPIQSTPLHYIALDYIQGCGVGVGV